MKKIILTLVLTLLSVTLLSQIKVVFFRDVPPIYADRMYDDLSGLVPRLLGRYTYRDTIVDLPKIAYCPRLQAYDADPYMEAVYDSNAITLAITYKPLIEDCNDSIGYYGISYHCGMVSLVSGYDLGYFSRIMQTCIHELGHIFCLEHCKNKGCLMEADVSWASTGFCKECRKKLTVTNIKQNE